MNTLRNLIVVLTFCFVAFSCSKEDEPLTEPADQTAFMEAVGNLIDSNLDQGITFGMLKPEIDQLALDYGVQLNYPSKIVDDLVLNSPVENAFCWPWEEISLVSFYDYGEPGVDDMCILDIWYCDGVYDSWEYTCY